ncbi:alpha/beta fold hydrolase [Mangrovimonas sp. TPBH4]|uniref:alpha/beta fold hydrolase n=1 Tax=Mangrovimonas sp. TPBH4 TaxID=1645914 RepID=UPI0006B54AA3|nr:alpha/beta hydrolase [Mangrovimonas sp. TPBH4]
MRANIFLTLVSLTILLSCNQQKGEKVINQENEKQQEMISNKTANDYLTKDFVVQKENVSNHVRIYSKENSYNNFITIIPSVGRGVEDYTEMYNSTITTKLVETGYTVVLIQPRGIGKSKGDLTSKNIQLTDLANDIKTTLDSIGIKHLKVVGHAYGNRVARTFTTMYPDYVEGLALLACGGNFEIDPEVLKSVQGSLDLSLPDEERLKNLARAFFAKGNDPSVWLNGWYPELAYAQNTATANTDGNYYKNAGGKPFLVVQATEDAAAPPEKAGKILKKELGDQVTYIEVEHAGHALTSEQPNEIAEDIIKYFENK